VSSPFAFSWIGNSVTVGKQSGKFTATLAVLASPAGSIWSLTLAVIPATRVAVTESLTHVGAGKGCDAHDTLNATAEKVSLPNGSPVRVKLVSVSGARSNALVTGAPAPVT
jgi:hypothetical protein